MGNRVTLRITEHGLVDIPEQVTAKGAMVVARGQDIIVVKQPGRHHYSTQGGQWPYAEGAYTVYRERGPSIFGGPPNTPGLDEYIPVEEITDFPLRQNGPTDKAYRGVKS